MRLRDAEANDPGDPVVTDTGVQTALTVTHTVQDVQDAMAAINGRIRESEGTPDTGFMNVLGRHNGPDYMIYAPLGATAENQTVSLEVDSQDLEGVNAAGDLPMVSNNVTQCMDELVRVLREQSETERLDNAIKELDRAMERLIIRLASGYDNTIQQSESVNAMQASVNALLSHTTDLYEPVLPVVPDKTLLEQIADMLQIISSVVKAHYMQQHLQIPTFLTPVMRAEGTDSAPPILSQDQQNSVNWLAAVPSTSDQRPPHRTVKLINLQIAETSDASRRSEMGMSTSGSTVSGLSVMFIESGSLRSVIPLKLPERMTDETESAIFQLDNGGINIPGLVNIRLSSGFNMVADNNTLDKQDDIGTIFETKTSEKFNLITPRKMSADVGKKIDTTTETMVNEVPYVNQCTEIETKNFCQELYKGDTGKIKTEIGKPALKVEDKPCNCNKKRSSECKTPEKQKEKVCETCCYDIDSIQTQTDSSFDGSLDIVAECIERATKRQRMGSFHKTLCDLEYDLKSMGKLISDSYHVMSHSPKCMPPTEESALNCNTLDLLIGSPPYGTRDSMSAAPSMDRRIPGVYEPSTRQRRAPSGDPDRFCKTAPLNSIDNNSPAYRMDTGQAQMNFLEHCVRHFKERGTSDSGVPWTPSLPALNTPLPTAQRSLAPPYVTSPDDYFTK